MSFILSYKPQIGQEKYFEDLAIKGNLQDSNELEELMILGRYGLHPAETICCPCVGSSELANNWIRRLFKMIKSDDYLIDYPFYHDVINSLEDFYEVNSLAKYCQNGDENWFLSVMEGKYIKDLITQKDFLPTYNQLGKGAIPEWSYNIFNFEFNLQNEIFGNDKISDEIRDFFDYDILTPKQAIKIGNCLKSLLPEGKYRLLINIQDIAGFPDLMPFEIDYHKIASLGVWFVKWGESGHYFMNTEKGGINLSLDKNYLT